MAVASVGFRNSCLDARMAATGNNLQVKLHSADPGAGGTSNELSGGGYTAQAVTMGAASAGVIANTNEATFTVGTSTTVAWASLWDDATWIANVDVTDAVLGGGGQVKVAIGAVTVAYNA
jgi:hypothetical protein